MQISTRFEHEDLQGDLALGGDLRVPRRFALTATGPELGYRVEMTVVLRAGRFVCEQLTCSREEGGLPVTNEGIRELPVAELIRRGAESVLLRVDKVEPGGAVRRVEISDSIGATDTVQISVVGGISPERLTAQGPTDDALQAVAAAYRLAHATGTPPTKAVMRQLGLTRSTAGRWVMLARKRGFLGSAAPRRAGETPDDR